jgi:cyclophilin family peptidyl-prolyl cis-trans isomerase
MKKITGFIAPAVLFAAFLLGSCGESENAVQRAARLEAERLTAQGLLTPDKPKKVEKPEVEPLTDSTAKSFLTKYAAENPEKIVLLKTTMGDIKVRLYDDVPLHRANFIWLVKNGFYGKTIFYRVVNEFMIQGGSPEGKRIPIGIYKVPNEVKSKYFHKRGALAMARQDENNPQKGSSSHDFYIVHGRKYTPAELGAFARQNDQKLSQAQRTAYTTVGGVPHLDGKYTVFGEVIEGMDVINKIAAVKTDSKEWPIKDVEINMEIVK